MKQKGSKYARKHFLEPKQEKNVPYPSEFADFFENHYGFEKRFLSLGYEEQLKLVNCLYNLSSAEDKQYAELASFYINKLHELTDSDYEEGIYEPVAVDEKRLIRMDCYGSISRRRPDQLSDFYKYFKSKAKSQKHLLREYELKDSPSWRVLAQFESFRSIEPKIKRALYKSQINPDALKVMTVNDYCDVIFNTFYDGNGEKAHFIPSLNCIKNRFIRQFMKECGDAFYRVLMEKNIDERAVKSLCNKMRNYGLSDLESLTVTETHYTARALADLSKHGFDIRGIEVGEPISEKFINYLIDTDQESLIIARNPDGSLVDKYVLPRLEVHHNRAVQFADSEYLASSNYPNRLVMLESKIHRQYYHLFDSIIKQNDIQNYFSRLNISSKYMRMRLGFAYEDAIMGDFENTASFHKRALVDKNNRVNYFEMQKILDNNKLKMQEKYNLDFTNFGAKNQQKSNSKKKMRKKADGKTKLFNIKEYTRE